MKQERNAKCACGSGQKYKKCCLLTERENARLAEIEWKARMARRAEERREAERAANEALIEQAKSERLGVFFGGKRHGLSAMMAVIAMMQTPHGLKTPPPTHKP